MGPRWPIGRIRNLVEQSVGIVGTFEAEFTLKVTPKKNLVRSNQLAFASRKETTHIGIVRWPSETPIPIAAYIWISAATSSLFLFPN